MSQTVTYEKDEHGVVQKVCTEPARSSTDVQEEIERHEQKKLDNTQKAVDDNADLDEKITELEAEKTEIEAAEAS